MTCVFCNDTGYIGIRPGTGDDDIPCRKCNRQLTIPEALWIVSRLEAGEPMLFEVQVMARVIVYDAFSPQESETPMTELDWQRDEAAYEAAVEAREWAESVREYTEMLRGR